MKNSDLILLAAGVAVAYYFLRPKPLIIQCDPKQPLAPELPGWHWQCVNGKWEMERDERGVIRLL